MLMMTSSHQINLIKTINCRLPPLFKYDEDNDSDSNDDSDDDDNDDYDNDDDR